MLLTCYYLIFKEKNVPKKNDRIFLVLHRNEIYNSRAVTQCLAFPQLRDRTEHSLWPVSHRCVLETPLERWIVLQSLVRTTVYRLCPLMLRSFYNCFDDITQSLNNFGRVVFQGEGQQNFFGGI